MKKLSIEEKAKAYDEIIERLKDFQFEYRFSPFSDVISDKFPELKESENWIPKEIIKYLKEKADFRSCWIAWLEKQGEPDKFRDSIQVGDKVTRNRDGMLVNLSQLKRVAKPAEEYNITGIGSKNAQGKLGEMIKNLKSADKVEPKFKVGDWIIRSAENFEHNKYLITEIRDYYTCKDLKDRRVTFTFNDVHKNFKLWDISDAKDGDVLSYRNGQWIFIFKEIKNNNSIIEYYVLLSERGLEVKNAALTSLISAILPATKEQRGLLFQKMKEAGYEWDAKKKEPTKIEQKHFCKLDNSYARIKFPFKAKVKSSGKIVTIHDGQLSYDGKEWIKYQSDAKDGYKVYEPNDLLELVCETEYNPAWSKEDDKCLKLAIDNFQTLGNSFLTSWLKGLKDKIQSQPKQNWSEEDENIVCFLINVTENYRIRNGFSSVVEQGNKAIDWLKSLKDRCLSHSQS